MSLCADPLWEASLPLPRHFVIAALETGRVHRAFPPISQVKMGEELPKVTQGERGRGRGDGRPAQKTTFLLWNSHT